VKLDAFLTSSPAEVAAGDAVILPGVGGMPEAMRILDKSGLSDAIRESAAAGTPLLGICLGLQLLMSRGSEFGPHDGLGIIDGDVIRFEGNDAAGAPLKVPHIGWTGIAPVDADRWSTPMLKGVPVGGLMYFVHSYYVRPANPEITAATAAYESVEFCAAISRANIFACQFHPERSGPIGLRIYRNFAESLVRRGADAPVTLPTV
jgi:glutamine amidotransferase